MKLNFLHNIIEFDTIDSTNLYLKNNYQSLPDYTAVIAKHQTSGHGQFSRVWESNANENLLFSLLIKEGLPCNNQYLNDVIIKSIITTLHEFGVSAHYKYPNDVYIDEKKIAGTLIETKYQDKKLEYIIIGIGLNVNQEHFETPKAISLFQIIKNKIDIKSIFHKILNYISKNFQGLLNSKQ